MSTSRITLDAEISGEYPPDIYNFDRRALPLSHTDAISSTGQQSFRDDGYLAINDLLSSNDISNALAGLAAILAEPRGAIVQYEAEAADVIDQLTGEQRMDYVRKFMSFINSDDRLYKIAGHPAILQVVRALCGSEEVVLLQDMALLKPPGVGREKPWHQDNAFFNFEPGTPIVGIWIALDAATAENGCMHVIPGSHRDGPQPHFRRRDFQLCDTEVRTTEDTMVPLMPGSALMFHGLLHHGTPANRSKTRRRALQFHYVPRSAVPMSDDRRLTIFGSEGKNVTC